MSELPDYTDVLVIGAGPTGLALAATLRAVGVGCCVIDKAEEGHNHSRAVGTLPRTLEMLHQLEVAERMAEVGNVARRVRIFSRDRDRDIATLRLDRLRTDFPYAVLLPQHATERILLCRLRELGGDVHRPFRLCGLRQSGDEVVATAVDAVGEKRTLRAAYAVGADGAGSAVRKLIGVDYPGDAFRHRLVLADLQLDGGSPPDEVHLFFSRAGTVIMGNMPGGLHRVCLSVDDVPHGLTPGTAEELLLERLPVSRRIHVQRLATDSDTPVQHRVAERYRTGRVFLAGDAAHTNSPIIGQGMNLGIQDAITLGNLLATVFLVGEDDLDAYERVRRPIARNAVAVTRRIQRLATERSAWKGGVRDAVFSVAPRLPAVNRAMLARMTRLIDR
ncbi:FAD-dependent oxidoreductase [Streptomyces sp. 184]|uniref:FAD-dependent oxidoreductase n=1 Tax=Streptomyces sp. 184 TaxID=1827526 RepID=UPI0038913428